MIPTTPAKPIHQATKQLRLFAFPFAGGNSAAFRPWVGQLAAHIELVPVELAGRGRRMSQPAFRRMNAQIADIANTIGPQLDQPYVLFGHSMGALLSFELARYLRRHGAPAPRALLVSGHRAPQLADHEPTTYTNSDADLLTKLRSLGGTPAEILEQQELMSLLMPMIRADFEVCETYAYYDEPPFDFPICAFGGLADQRAGTEQLKSWSVHTTSAFRQHMFPGGHFYIQSAQTSFLWQLNQTVSQLLAGTLV